MGRGGIQPVTELQIAARVLGEVLASSPAPGSA
jgi:hypothetical protein